MDDVRLVERLAVDENPLVHQLDVIARHADAALHVIHGDERGMAEDDDVAALHVFVGQQMLAQRVRRRIGQLVDDQVIAGEQGVVHRSGGDDERLRDGGGAEQQDQDRDGPLGHRVALRGLRLPTGRAGPA